MNLLFGKSKLLKRYDFPLLELGFKRISNKLKQTGYEYSINRVYLKDDLLCIVSIPNAPEQSISFDIYLVKEPPPNLSFYYESKDGFNYLIDGTSYDLFGIIPVVVSDDIWNDYMMFGSISDLKEKVNKQVGVIPKYLPSVMKKLSKRQAELTV